MRGSRGTGPHPYLADGPRPRIIAHRGFAALNGNGGAVENTRAAFAAALAAGADAVETDCWLSRDGAVVLFHDGDLARVAGDPRRIDSLTLEHLRGIMADRGGLLTLSEALDAFPEARFNIDVKSSSVAEAAGSAVAGHGDRVLLTSFSDSWRRRALRTAVRAVGSRHRPATSGGRATIARALTALRTGSSRVFAATLSGIDALQIPEYHGRIRVLSSTLIDAAHRAGVEVHVWTVNDPDRMRELAALGVDGIITDRTDLAVAALRV